MKSNTTAVVLGILSSAFAKNTHMNLHTRDIIQQGGWSLSVPMGSGCPSMTTSCFTNQTGNFETAARGGNCCPSQALQYSDEYGQQVQTPLYCGTYVNTGQPYACCPLANADCRGDVGAVGTTQKCANSGWAQWRIPDGGFNHFCCLPGEYGYWLPAGGQDAVGQCSLSNVLPTGAQPAEQLDNGDGTVSSDGTQLVPIPSATPTPAPVCDVIANYGWSLQVSSADKCTTGSTLCGYGIGCCPNSLKCGTVIGDSEVPVCCPADNPDCRGAVEGLAVQPCADSSWSLWHVNTNGNHFCCKAGQIGYNVVNDNNATGFCGDAVPVGQMRSILDYPGDGSTPGSNTAFPCDSQPRPDYSLQSMISSILGNPNPTSAPSVVAPIAAALPSLYANISTIVYTTTITTVPADCSATLTYAVQGFIAAGTHVPLQSDILIAPSEHADVVSQVLATVYGYSAAYSQLPSTVPEMVQSIGPVGVPNAVLASGPVTVQINGQAAPSVPLNTATASASANSGAIFVALSTSGAAATSTAAATLGAPIVPNQGINPSSIQGSIISAGGANATLVPGAATGANGFLQSSAATSTMRVSALLLVAVTLLVACL